MHEQLTRPMSMANRMRTVRRTTALVTVAAALLVSCGDDDDAAADPARFCDVNGELEQLDEFTTASPEDARDLVRRTRDLLAEADDTSPDEIRSEVNATTESFRELLDFYADADFEVDPSVFEAALESGDLGTDPPEAEVVFDWIDENCAQS
jgi:tellurite resistance protein